MGGQRTFLQTAGDRRHDHGGAVSVPNIVLSNQRGVYVALLAAYYRFQISIKCYSCRAFPQLYVTRDSHWDMAVPQIYSKIVLHFID